MKKLSLIFGSFLFCIVAALAWAGVRETDTGLKSAEKASALNISPTDATLERPDNPITDVNESAELPLVDTAITKPLADDATITDTSKTAEKTVKTTAIAAKSVIRRPEKPHNNGFVAPLPVADRVYHVRSVTANNPNYKTRFSILHETPSPKRVAGERLYNLSDEAFRLKAKGNRLYLDGSPVFYLTGINKAKGNTGELRLYEGGYLDIQDYSPRFRGYWDADGTGENDLKITPSRLVSGELPARLITRKKDGTIITDEEHTLTFKAMAAGPYNGYWSDGDNVNVFLWGMSRSKLKSKEFTYLGLDLGVTTFGSVPTGSIAPGPKPEEPGDPTGSITPAPEPQPLDVTSSISQAPEGLVPLPINPIPGGNIPGNNFVPPIITPPTPPGVPRPNRPPVTPPPGERPFCERFPNDPQCNEKCDINPNLPECNCIKNPDIPECKPDTPVNEPGMIMTMLGLLLAARELRARQKKNEI